MDFPKQYMILWAADTCLGRWWFIQCRHVLLLPVRDVVRAFH
jgi:hypothetical protein